MQGNTSPAELTADAIRRRLRLWQSVVFVGIVGAICTINVFTELTDLARGGTHLPWWKPALWEASSALMLWLLIPLIARLYRVAPLTAQTWRWALPLHLVATLPFSLAHVGGMVALRKLGYAAMHAHYEFGDWWPNWIYEYRKDLVAYLLIVGGLRAFHLYQQSLEGRLAVAQADDAARTDTVRADTVAAPATAVPIGTRSAPLERLVVKKRNREFILNTSEIDRIDADGNYVSIHALGETWPLRESLAALESRLDARHFARVHRRHIVNLDRIREIQPWDSGDYRIVLADGSFVNFSRRYRGRLPQLFH